MKSSLPRPRRVPQRTCVACRTTGGKRGLLRVVRLPEEAGVALDPSGKKNGRGAYICPTTACVTIALKRKALERSLKVPIPEEITEQLRVIVAERDAAEATDTIADASATNTETNRELG